MYRPQQLLNLYGKPPSGACFFSGVECGEIVKKYARIREKDLQNPCGYAIINR
jgi:hypothetical protein